MFAGNDFGCISFYMYRLALQLTDIQYAIKQKSQKSTLLYCDYSWAKGFMSSEYICST